VSDGAVVLRIERRVGEGRAEDAVDQVLGKLAATTVADGDLGAVGKRDGAGGERGGGRSGVWISGGHHNGVVSPAASDTSGNVPRSKPRREVGKKRAKRGTRTGTCRFQAARPAVSARAPLARFRM